MRKKYYFNIDEKLPSFEDARKSRRNHNIYMICILIFWFIFLSGAFFGCSTAPEKCYDKSQTEYYDRPIWKAPFPEPWCYENYLDENNLTKSWNYWNIPEMYLKK